MAAQTLSRGSFKVGNIEGTLIDPVEILWAWLREGWRYRVQQGNLRLKTHRDFYLDQMKREMELIISKDFVSYFLLVSDLVRFAKDRGIAVGPGRGSSAASLVCYLLRITEPDPLQFPLTDFTRFIDPTRIDLPDIDVDFDDKRRWEVRDYAVERYGADCVANIITFTKYKGKNSITDVGRVYSIPPVPLAVVKGMIIERSGGDSRADASLEDTFASFPPATEILALYPKLQMASELEGNYRGMSTHAAGLVISDTPIADVCAMYSREDKSGRVLSGVAVNKYDAEYIGLMKIDILGLTTMGEIAEMLRLTGMTLEELYALPLDDEITFEAFKRADVVGVFQFEGRATRLVCREVQPGDIYELIHVNALSRPGPLFSGTTTEFINIKRGLMEIPLIHPILDKIASTTRGQIIYQEQVLHSLAQFGGLPVQRVHDIRRIISQKLGEAQFNASSENFITGAMDLHKVPREVAAKVWERVVTSASYAFVYSHSLSYSIIGYWCQWFKQHYPTQFFQVKLGRTPDKELPMLVKDAERHNVRIKGVTLGASGTGWTSPRDGELVAGFETLPGVGPAVSAKIIARQEERGHPYAHAADLLEVSGIGPATLAKMMPLINVDDPFGLRRLESDMDRVRQWLPTAGLPTPTHISDELLDVSEVTTVWLGFVLERNYQDYVENKRARYGTEVADIIASMKRPDLKTSVVLRCIDDHDEDVYVRINRFDFPGLKRRIDAIVVGRDMVLVRGRKSDKVAAFGISVQTKWLVSIDPND